MRAKPWNQNLVGPVPSREGCSQGSFPKYQPQLRLSWKRHENGWMMSQNTLPRRIFSSRQVAWDLFDKLTRVGTWVPSTSDEKASTISLATLLVNYKHGNHWGRYFFLKWFPSDILVVGDSDFFMPCFALVIFSWLGNNTLLQPRYLIFGRRSIRTQHLWHWFLWIWDQARKYTLLLILVFGFSSQAFHLQINMLLNLQRPRRLRNDPIINVTFRILGGTCPIRSSQTP